MVMMHGRQIALTTFSAACLVIASSCSPPAAAQSPKPATSAESTTEDPLNRISPQSSVSAFLALCDAHDYGKAARYLDLRKFAADQRRTVGPERAQELDTLLDRDPQFFEGAALSRRTEGNLADGLPAQFERVASFQVNGKTLELQLERIELRSGSRVWVFSAASVDAIPKLFQATSESFIERHLPEPLVTWKLMETALWRWIALILLALVLGVLGKALSRLAMTLVRLLSARIAPKLDTSKLNTLLGPFQVLLFAMLFRAGMEPMALSPTLKSDVLRGLATLVIAGVAWLALRICDLGVDRLRQAMEARHNTFSRSALPLASRLLKLTILIFALTAILARLGYGTTTILTTLGIGGVAIALAAQKTIENLFGGVSVISDRPVFVGDFCRFGERTGTIEDIGLRSTRIRTLDRTVVSVPNGEFAAMILENFSRRDKVWFHHTLNLRRDTTPDQVRQILSAIQKLLNEHSNVEVGPIPVRFVGVGTYSLDLEVFAYVLTSNWDEYLTIQQELLLRLLDEVAAAGTALALPTQASVAYSVQPGPIGPASEEREPALNSRRSA
jgi:MscS family membrane protein